MFPKLRLRSKQFFPPHCRFSSKLQSGVRHKGILRSTKYNVSPTYHYTRHRHLWNIVICVTSYKGLWDTLYAVYRFMRYRYMRYKGLCDIVICDVRSMLCTRLKTHDRFVDLTCLSSSARDCSMALSLAVCCLATSTACLTARFSCKYDNKVN